jgi:hypothetical protein
MRLQICLSWLFDPDEVKITMKMSSLLKLRIIDHELCVCEYGLRGQGPAGQDEGRGDWCSIVAGRRRITERHRPWTIYKKKLPKQISTPAQFTGRHTFAQTLSSGLYAPYLSYLTQIPEDAGKGEIHGFSLYVFYIHTVHTASSSLSLSTCHSVIIRSESVNHMQIPCCYFPWDFV